MNIEIAITISAIIGLCIGLYANHNGIKERDERIHELEGELTVKQNVAESLNATVQRLRRELNRLKNKDNKIND